MKRGFFITVEGGEGAGKTSAIEDIHRYLSDKGHAVVTTREPGGIPIAEQIRSVLLDKRNTAMEGRTEALLYAAARRQHLVEKVAPALQQGAVVVCDRFIDSSLAYQGHARGLGMDAVLGINQFAIEGYMPDLTIYMEVTPEIGLSRIHANGGREVNRLDLEAVSFHHKVREGYRLAAERFPERIVRVDADKDREDVLRSIRAILEARVPGTPNARLGQNGV